MPIASASSEFMLMLHSSMQRLQRSIDVQLKCMFSMRFPCPCLSSLIVSFVSSYKWAYLQWRHRNQTATTVRCNQLQWLPPSFPARRGRYRAGREGDLRSAMSPRWIFLIATLNRSLHSKCPRRGGESRASRSARWERGRGAGGWVVVCVGAVCLKIHVYTDRETPCPSDFVGSQHKQSWS